MEILRAALSLGILGLIFGVLLGYAAKKFEVKVDPKIPQTREVLPGANCGGCGYPGCDAYAEAVVEGGAKANLCSVGGAAVVDKISDILGIAVDVAEKKTAYVKCSGTCTVAKNKYEISGVKDCLEAAAMVGGGQKGCSYGCLGLGSCVQVCEFGALNIVDGIAKVDMDKCTNCGACIDICPKGLIESVPFDSKVRVACNSNEFGKIVRDNCSNGCIGCSICQKNCPSGAITITDKLAKVDYSACTQCGVCTTKCPTKAIKTL